MKVPPDKELGVSFHLERWIHIENKEIGSYWARVEGFKVHPEDKTARVLLYDARRKCELYCEGFDYEGVLSSHLQCARLAVAALRNYLGGKEE